ncbi:MAG: hypothetical protein GQ544_00345 [Candidatus Aminicenantes bacterium]|nr:hypothetical protein [Candidatus Aminicenantes bacterium]
MDFLKFALQMEYQIIQNYKNLAEQCLSHEGIRRILLMLVEDLEKHVSTLMRMKDKPTWEMDDSQVFKEADQLFAKMRKEKETFSCDIDQLQLYREARALLQKNTISTMTYPKNSNRILPCLCLRTS